MKGENIIAFLIMEMTLLKTSKPNFFSANKLKNNNISDSNTHEHVKMANVNLHSTLSTLVQALKCPSFWNSFLSST